MTQLIIQLSGVDKFYGDFQALSQIDLDIRTGEFFSLLGPSGCGKTTLLRSIAGFETPSAGSLHCLLYTSPSPRDKRQSRMPSSA